MDDKLGRFEKMRDDIIDEHRAVTQKIEDLKLENKTKTATFKQLMAQKLTLSSFIETYRKYDLL